MLFCRKQSPQTLLKKRELTPVAWKETTILNDKKESLPIMNFKLELKQEVRKDIFDYFTA